MDRLEIDNFDCWKRKKVWQNLKNYKLSRDYKSKYENFIKNIRRFFITFLLQE